MATQSSNNISQSIVADSYNTLVGGFDISDNRSITANIAVENNVTKKTDLTYEIHSEGNSNIVGDSDSVPFEIRVYEIKLEEGGFFDLETIIKGGEVRISAEPKMPYIGFHLRYDESLYRLNRVTLDIKYSNKFSSYRRDTSKTFTALRRNAFDIPSENLKAYTFEVGDYIGGGHATIFAEAEINGQTKKFFFKFQIKGTNPSYEAVAEYISQRNYNSKYWFFSALVRQESYHAGHSQFASRNSVLKYAGEIFELTEGYPLFGPPDGYGLVQLDYSSKGEPANFDYIWNWKANIDLAIKKIDTKVGEVSNFFNNFYTKNKKEFDSGSIQNGSDLELGGVTYIHAPSTILGFERINDLLFNNGRPTDNLHKSFIDATLIKYYNGNDDGNRSSSKFYSVINGKWVARDNVNDYVEQVSKRYRGE